MLFKSFLKDNCQEKSFLLFTGNYLSVCFHYFPLSALQNAS